MWRLVWFSRSWGGFQVSLEVGFRRGLTSGGTFRKDCAERGWRFRRGASSGAGPELRDAEWVGRLSRYGASRSNREVVVRVAAMARRRGGARR